MLTKSPPRARILVVDDDPGLRVMLTKALEHEGYDAVAASSVDRALDRLAGQPVDLVLTDIVMPNRSGLVLLLDLHADYPHIPALAMTASDDGVMREAALALGARRVLRKPFRPRDLVRAVEATLSTQPAFA